MTQDSDNLEQNMQEIQENLQEEIHEQTEDINESDGFLTSKGRLFSRAEWHASVLGFAPVGIGYLLPSPLGELFVVAELMMLRTGFNKKMKNEEVTGHLGDVVDEVAYTFGFSFLATVVFYMLQVQYGIGSLTSLDLGGLLVTMLGGA